MFIHYTPYRDTVESDRTIYGLKLLPTVIYYTLIKFYAYMKICGITIYFLYRYEAYVTEIYYLRDKSGWEFNLKVFECM